MRADAVALATDADHIARIVLATSWNEHVGRSMTSVLVQTGDVVWNVYCWHGHTTEATAEACARKVVAPGWREMRDADEVVVVNGGNTIEWQWHAADPGVKRMTYKRCTPALPPDDARLTDLGLVDEVRPLRRRTSPR